MAQASTYDSTGVSYYKIPSFTTASGTLIPNLKVAYKSLNPTSTHGTVLIPTCYGGLINTTLTFSTPPNNALSNYHIVVAAMLGNGESSSPSNHASFPTDPPGSLHYEDCIRAHHALLTSHLHVSSLEAVIGFSMGGQQAYYWAVLYPSFVRRAVMICSSARTSPHNYAFLEGPINALASSVDYAAWKEVQRKIAAGDDVGPNLRKLKAERGLRAFGRAYNAWLTSATWFRERWWGEREDGGLGCKSVDEFMVWRSDEAYLGWNPDDLLVLARMWQMGDVGSVCGDEKAKTSTLGGGLGDDELYEKALKGITAEVLLMPCRTDQYFPPEDSEIEMKYLQKGRLGVIESVWGHVAGGGMNPKDVEFMNANIASFLSQ